MDILSQFPVSSSLCRSLLLLAAPPIPLALPSPRIAGLLTAGAAPQRSPNQDYLVFEKRLTWEEVQTQLICPTLEEMDDEIDAIITHYRERKQHIRQVHVARQWAAQVGPTSKSEGV